jgi:hypothetical protein
VTLPFSEQEFFEVFSRYNTRVWPVVRFLWFATVSVVVQLVRGRSTSVGLDLLLAFHFTITAIAQGRGPSNRLFASPSETRRS